MKERLELVTDFATLRAGMIVVDAVCQICGGKPCRGMLLQLEELADDEYDPVAWSYTGPCTSWYDNEERFCGIGPSDVAERHVYRVIDGLESGTTERKRKSVRA